jgi:RNA polymerase sigma factor for flagellar operon FliA
MEPDRPYGLADLAVAAASFGQPPDLPDAEARQHQEAGLWQRHRDQHDPQAREELILRYLPYAKAVAGGLYRQHIHHEAEFQEYVQWATLGLIEALDRYDPQRGAQFTTYAHARIQGAIRNGLAHISERQEQTSLHRRLRAERAAAAQLQPGLADRSAADQHLVGNMAEIAAGLMLSLLLDDTGMLQTAEQALPDGCYESVAFKHERKRLWALVGQLTPREQAVVRLHYLQGLTYEDVAQSLGITKGRVAQLHGQALGRLRKLMAP